MKRYPSIPSFGEIGRDFYKGMTIFAFDKLDGSNIGAEWTRKKGFWKFSKRNALLSDEHPVIHNAQQLFLDKYSEDLDKIFRKQRWEKATAFFEFYGPSSFAGNHDIRDQHSVTLFDVHMRDVLPPREFLKLFGHLDTPALLHEGHVNHEFADKVMNGELKGMTFEGVVCKGANKKKGLVMFKIKSRAWVDQVRSMYRDNDQKIKELL